jgi:hypothetical protein
MRGKAVQWREPQQPSAPADAGRPKAGHVKIARRMKKAFRISAKSVAAPLSFDEVRVKYRASDADVRAVKLFVSSDSAGLATVAGGKGSGRSSARHRSSRASGGRKK